MTSTPLSHAHVRTAGRITLTVALMTAVTATVVGHVADPADAAPSSTGLSGQPIVVTAAKADPRLEARRTGAEVRRADAARAARLAAAAQARLQARRQAEATRAAQRDPRGAARALLAQHGWSSGQFSCLDSLWTKESGWNHRALNRSSGAFGIAQALPGGKMASAGADWRTNPVTQIRWGLQYIHDVYGSPCSAWAHSQATNWY